MTQSPGADAGNGHRGEQHQGPGRDLLSRGRDLIRAGNAREIVVRKQDGDVVAQIPMTAGVVGAVVAPGLAAIGAVAALATKCSITVVTKEQSTDD